MSPTVMGDSVMTTLAIEAHERRKVITLDIPGAFPNADLDLAVKDIAYSAFGHAGQKCSAASLVILVGSVAKSKRFIRQLEDAVKSIHVAHPQDPMAQMGPVIEAPQGKLLEGLTSLERGESWLAGLLLNLSEHRVADAKLDVALDGGDLRAADRSDGVVGAVFSVWLPCETGRPDAPHRPA